MTRVRTEQGLERLARERGGDGNWVAAVPERVRETARGDHSVQGENMDGVQLSPAELQATEAELGALQSQLEAQLALARSLTEPLHDGTGPVAAPMRREFLHRADAEGGVEAALHEYIAEVAQVRTWIGEALAAYTATDAERAQAFTQIADGMTTVHRGTL
ncbi:hypothetical protein [Actinokineospora bangkokensis]|uniref:Uncharacterized protein n=1 Tax=Actinokineospora bangkokensis TaxID=1193682 RepID=A0A1Q9LFL7_9PSEU|nr:hypothetical protein [Actinokineospora bangkokensis]OLR90818.1 hypothetical protein BJP25_30070 [Actinokineospora bangkokensis]